MARVTSVEENIAIILVGFSLYESVYSEAALAALNASAGQVTSERGALVVALTALCIMCVRFTETDRWVNAGRDRNLVWRLLSNLAMAGAIGLAYACFDTRLAFTLAVGLLVYQFSVIWHPSAPEDRSSPG